ncbi:MAG TPA: dephospho-CoA kinase [Gemmatimonadaceae bacterium]|nr:dephospho-CoA kinase [Gemmatimonadaceae bacterium]
MLLVGLTGNIASGKSSVARRFAELGATVIDADVLAREAVAAGTPAYRAIVDRWGEDVIAADGSLDRASLRQRVFAESDELDALNAIVHPEVARLRDQMIAEARARGDAIVVSDIPLLFERKLVDEFDRIVLVDAPRPMRLERLMRDRALDETEAMNMIAAQMPAELKRARADYIIDNVGTLEELKRRTDAVWQMLDRDARDTGNDSRASLTPASARR